jgi:hypothetical protein
MSSGPLFRTGRLQWAGVAVGALIVISAYLYLAVSQNHQLDPGLLLPISSLVGGAIAGVLSRGGVRGGALSGFLAGVIGTAGLGIVMAAQFVAMFGTVTAMWLLVFALYGILVLPAAVVGGAVGGALSGVVRPPAVSVSAADRENEIKMG